MIGHYMYIYFYRIKQKFKMDDYSLCPCVRIENPKVIITVYIFFILSF